MSETATCDRDQPGISRPGAGILTAGTAFDMEPAEIAGARDFARDFLADVEAVHGRRVSSRALGITQLVVSELATNICKYAPGPCLLDLEIRGNMLGITMWDSGTLLPAARQADPTRAGQHGLEIVLAVCQSFEVRREPVGKRIRVLISLLDDPHDDPAGHTPW